MQNKFIPLAMKAIMGTSLIALGVSISAPVYAQTTVSSVRGVIADDAGLPISGAQIRVTDERTGATRTVTTDSGGGYSVRNLNVGGPYTVSVTSDGLQSKRIQGISVDLSGSTIANFNLSSGDGDEIIVTATRQSVQKLATGPSSVFSSATIEALPSISRDIRDVIRIDPRLTVSGGDSQVSCLGASPRSTSFTVDGISINDQFGLNASGAPARGNFPIPLDAIQETAVEFAPFNVEYGNFESCNVNIVTKRGSNEFHGDAFYVINTSGLTGSEIDGQTVVSDSSFTDQNWGATFRGPIIKDKLFFALTYEEIRDGGTIVGFGPEGGTFANPVSGFTDADVQAIEAAAQALGFETGGLASTVPETSRRILGRLDWQINDNHRLELGYDMEEELEVEADLFDVDFQFLNSFENSGSDIDRYSARLFSNWSDKFSTEVRVSRADITDIQNPVGGGEAQDANPIPRITVRGRGQGADFVPFGGGDDGIQVAGPGFFRSANALVTTLDELKIKGDYVVGDHLITAGYELNSQDVFNLFAPNATGTFVFDTVEDLQAGLASSITAISSNSGDINDAAAEFSRSINSFYLQDTWTPDDQWAVTLGLRYDFYTSDDVPQESQAFFDRYGFSNSTGYDGLDVFLPRFGVTYDAGETFRGSTKFRAGIGIFSGGFPNVTFSNAFTNNGFGTAFGSAGGGACTAADLQVVNGGTFTGIPQCIQDQIAASTAAGTGRTDAIDPDLKVASVLRSNFGFSHYTDFAGAAGGFFDDWQVDLDFIYTQNRNSFDFVDLTLASTNIVLPDGRVVVNAIDPLNAGCDATFGGPRVGFQGDAASFANGTACDAGGDDQDILLTNALDGENGRAYSFSARFGKTFDYELFNRPAIWDVKLGYSYTDATAAVGNLSSTATSQFEEIAVRDINQTIAGPTSFSNPHVISFSTTFKQEFIEDAPTSFSLFLNARDGNPFSYTYDNNTPTTLFGDSDNEERNLFYVPTGPNDPLVQFAPGFDTAAFFDFINESGLSEFAGQVSPRNAFNDPWFVDIDLRLQQEVPTFIDGVTTSFFADFENFLNLIDSGSNIQRRFDRGDVGEAVPVLDAALSADGTQFIYSGFPTSEINFNDGFDDIVGASLWQIQFGVKVSF